MKAQINGYVVKFVDEEFAGESIQDCIKLAKEKYPHIYIETINNKVVAGYCESCGKPIYESSTLNLEYYCDADGVMWCCDHENNREEIGDMLEKLSREFHEELKNLEIGL